MVSDGKIHFRCPHCQKAVSVAAKHAGARGKCPGCSKAIWIPTDREKQTTEKSSKFTWRVIDREEGSRQAEALRVFPKGGGAAGILIPSVPQKNDITCKGQVKCHGCSNEIAFECIIYWGLLGGCPQLTCPSCGNTLTTGHAAVSLDGVSAMCFYVTPHSSLIGQRVKPISLFISEIDGILIPSGQTLSISSEQSQSAKPASTQGARRRVPNREIYQGLLIPTSDLQSDLVAAANPNSIQHHQVSLLSRLDIIPAEVAKSVLSRVGMTVKVVTDPGWPWLYAENQTVLLLGKPRKDPTCGTPTLTWNVWFTDTSFANAGSEVMLVTFDDGRLTNARVVCKVAPDTYCIASLFKSEQINKLLPSISMT